MEKRHFTYILQCADGTYYTGYTTDIQKREAAHNSGKGAKYTHSRRPVRMLYFEEYDTKEEAMRREYQIKTYSRKEKEALIYEKTDGDFPGHRIPR